MPRFTRSLAAVLVVAAALPVPAAAISEEACAPGSDILCVGSSTDAEQAEPYNTHAEVHAPGSMAQFQTFSWCTSGWGPSYCTTGASAHGGTTGVLPGGSHAASAGVVCYRATGGSPPLDTCLDANWIGVGVAAHGAAGASAAGVYYPGAQDDCVTVHVDGHTSRTRCESLP